MRGETLSFSSANRIEGISHNSKLLPSRLGLASLSKQSQSMNRQSGIALITVLLIFTLVTMLAASMTTREATEIQRTSSILAIEQAHQLALGAESGAIAILRFDQENMGDNDYAGDATQPNHDPWAYPIPLSFGEVNMTIHIYDLNSRINLNWLSNNHPSRDRAQKWLQALMRNLASGNAATGFATSGNVSGVLGAAASLQNGNQFDPNLGFVDYNMIGLFTDPKGNYDDIYLSKDVPYLSSKQPLTDTSELHLVETFDVAKTNIKLLAPYVTAIDDPDFKMNINTIPVELLSAMSEEASTNVSQAIVDKRAKQGSITDLGLDNVDEIWSDTAFDPVTKSPQDNNGDGAGNDRTGAGSGSDNDRIGDGNNAGNKQPPLWDKADFTVKSNYFEVFAEIDLAGRIETVTSIIRRDQNDYKVISRKFGLRQPNLSAQEIARRNQTLIGTEAAELVK